MCGVPRSRSAAGPRGREWRRRFPAAAATAIRRGTAARRSMARAGRSDAAVAGASPAAASTPGRARCMRAGCCAAKRTATRPPNDTPQMVARSMPFADQQAADLLGIAIEIVGVQREGQDAEADDNASTAGRIFPAALEAGDEHEQVRCRGRRFSSSLQPHRVAQASATRAAIRSRHARQFLSGFPVFSVC